jgi:hypothetical protein
LKKALAAFRRHAAGSLGIGDTSRVCRAKWALAEGCRGARDNSQAGRWGWVPFTARCHASGITRLSDWLNSTGRIVADQFGRRAPRWTRPVDIPLTTSPLDGFINPIRASIKPRAYGLKNRERTNRMLMLMQLHANRQDDQNAYVRHIRECLETNAGRPSITRRAIVDVAGPASLR